MVQRIEILVQIMDSAKLPQNIRQVIDIVNLSDYTSSLEGLEKIFSVIKKEDEFCDFTTPDGIGFRLHRDKNSVAKVDFDIRQDDVEEMDEDDFEDLGNEYFEMWQGLTAQFEKVFGKPKYSNGFANKGYPEDTEAQWVSLWSLGKKQQLTLEVHDGHDIIPQYINAVYRA